MGYTRDVFNWLINLCGRTCNFPAAVKFQRTKCLDITPFTLAPEINNSTKLVPYTILVSMEAKVNLVLTKTPRLHFLRISFPKLPEWVHRRPFLRRSRNHQFLLKPVRAARVDRELFPNLLQNIHFPSLPEEWKHLLTSESTDIFRSKTQQTRSCRMCEKWLKKARNGQRSQIDRRHNLTFPVPATIFQPKKWLVLRPRVREKIFPSFLKLNP